MREGESRWSQGASAMRIEEHQEEHQKEHQEGHQGASAISIEEHQEESQGASGGASKGASGGESRSIRYQTISIEEQAAQQTILMRNK